MDIINSLYFDIGKLDSNIVQYSKDCLELINDLIEIVDNKQR